MKKYIISVLLGLLLFPAISYAKCCDCWQDTYSEHIACPPFPLRIPGFGTCTVIYKSNRSEDGDAIGYLRLKNTGIEKLIGKMIHRTKPCGIDRSYIDEPRKLLGVTDEYLVLSSDILARGQFEIVREIWDDGNWEEWKEKPERLIIREMMGDEYKCFVTGSESKYNCARCGKKLARSIGMNNYYCTVCKTGFNIKEE